MQALNYKSKQGNNIKESRHITREWFKTNDVAPEIWRDAYLDLTLLDVACEVGLARLLCSVSGIREEAT